MVVANPSFSWFLGTLADDEAELERIERKVDKPKQPAVGASRYLNALSLPALLKMIFLPLFQIYFSNFFFHYYFK